MSEKFTIYLNSATATNTPTHSGDASNMSYTMTWPNIIPQRYQGRNFLVRSKFESAPINGTLTQGGTIFHNLSPVFVSYGQTSSPFLNSFTPVALQGTYGMYKCGAFDGDSIMTIYPTTDILNIQLFHNDGTAATDILNYVLVLSFELVEL